MKIVEICDALRAELMNNGYQYGFIVDGQIYKPNMAGGFDATFYHLANTISRVQDPALTRSEKVGTCIDAVLVMQQILNERNVPSKIWLLYQKEKNKVHTVLTFAELGITADPTRLAQDAFAAQRNASLLSAGWKFWAHYTGRVYRNYTGIDSYSIDDAVMDAAARAAAEELSYPALDAGYERVDEELLFIAGDAVPYSPYMMQVPQSNATACCVYGPNQAQGLQPGEILFVAYGQDRMARQQPLLVAVIVESLKVTVAKHSSMVPKLPPTTIPISGTL